MRIERSEKTTRDREEADGGLQMHLSGMWEDIQVKGRTQNPPGENA